MEALEPASLSFDSDPDFRDERNNSTSIIDWGFYQQPPIWELLNLFLLSCDHILDVWEMRATTAVPLNA